MELWGFSLSQWLVLVQHEMLLFAGIFFLIGAIDEFAVDIAWLWLRLKGEARDLRLSPEEEAPAKLAGPVAVFLPAWQEAGIIGPTIRHILRAWPYRELRLYVGCYRNDPATMEAASMAAQGDTRVRIVVVNADGPTTKADCLNRLYRALEQDEERQRAPVRMIVLHDAEDMVDPAGLSVLDRAISGAEMAQLPVLPEPQGSSRWIGSHYCEEFAEAHGKAMVVRDRLGVGLPLAGVGCAIRRDALHRLAIERGGAGPFAAECLTEDYELGVGLVAMGGRTRFLRYRTSCGRLVATRACFPARLDHAVRQKTRWLHGIAFQGWERLGWGDRPAEMWMRTRDRRGPLVALVLAVAYGLLLLSGIVWAFGLAGASPSAFLAMSPALELLLWVNLASLAWRTAWRFGFTAREYGPLEGVRSIPRMFVANVIAIMAGRRALAAYLRSFAGKHVGWDKTSHHAHPADLLRSLSEPAQ